MTRFAAWMDGVAAFDEGLFRLSRSEAAGLDPQCRVLLENTWAALQVRAAALPLGRSQHAFLTQPEGNPLPVSHSVYTSTRSTTPQDAAPALVGVTSLSSTGTYVGCVWSEYQVLQDAQRLKPSVASLTGSGLNFLVGRVSYTFAFQGERGWRRRGLRCSGCDSGCVQIDIQLKGGV